MILVQLLSWDRLLGGVNGKVHWGWDGVSTIGHQALAVHKIVG